MTRHKHERLALSHEIVKKTLLILPRDEYTPSNLHHYLQRLVERGFTLEESDSTFFFPVHRFEITDRCVVADSFAFLLQHQTKGGTRILDIVSIRDFGLPPYRDRRQFNPSRLLITEHAKQRFAERHLNEVFNFPNSVPDSVRLWYMLTQSATEELPSLTATLRSLRHDEEPTRYYRVLYPTNARSRYRFVFGPRENGRFPLKTFETTTR